MTKVGLVLEGGAMRGLYSAGVLDVFMQNNINLSKNDKNILRNEKSDMKIQSLTYGGRKLFPLLNAAWCDKI